MVKPGTTYAKRFNVTAITRDKEYDLTKDGSKGSKVLYFTMQPNGESEVLNITLHLHLQQGSKYLITTYQKLPSGRSSQGNIVTKYPVRKVTQVSVGQSSLSAMKVYIDDVSGRLNTDGRGRLGRLWYRWKNSLPLYKDGSYELSELDLTRKFDVNAIEMLSQYKEDMVIGAIYYEGEKGWTMVKRFKIETNTLAQKFYFIPEGITSKLYFATTHTGSGIKITYKNGGQLKSTVYARPKINRCPKAGRPQATNCLKARWWRSKSCPTINPLSQ